MKNQHGNVPFIVVIIIVVAIVAIGAWLKSNQMKNQKASELASPSPIASESPSPSPKFIITAASANPSPAASPQPPSTPQTQASQQPSPSQSPAPHVICYVYFDPTTGQAPVDVKLIYGASYSGDDYVTNVQWDWDGDGNWDTDFSTNNQHLSHIYTQPGSYTAKMHLQTKNGLTSDVCSNTITIQ